MASDTDLRFRSILTKIANLLGRGVVESVDDSRSIQELKIEILDGELRTEVERVQQYGFTSVPREGAEHVTICIGGRREQAITLAVDDRRYRLKNLASGEVAVYNDAGASIVLKANGDIEAHPASGRAVKVGGAADAVAMASKVKAALDTIIAAHNQLGVVYDGFPDVAINGAGSYFADTNVGSSNLKADP